MLGKSKSKWGDKQTDKRMKAAEGARKTSSPLHAMHGPYWVQTLAVSTKYKGKSRDQIFTRMLAGKKVLHIGYADWPITDPEANLHVQLDKVFVPS